MEYENATLSWLRYSAWMPLYPLGFFLEGFHSPCQSGLAAVTLTRSVPFFYSSGVYSVDMPNPANFSFNAGVGLVALLGVFPFIAFLLLSHMAAQRRKKIAGEDKDIKLE